MYIYCEKSWKIFKPHLSVFFFKVISFMLYMREHQELALIELFVTNITQSETVLAEIFTKMYNLIE